MFFNTRQLTKEDYELSDKDEWKIGILDLERKDQKNGPLPTHHFEKAKSFKRIYAISKDMIKQVSQNCPSKMQTKANPSLFKVSSDESTEK